jgi:murein DD-endopeptidase MepM/ murein hydrolase activator NlpD
MKKRTIAFLLFFLVSAMPIERPKTIEIDTEKTQRYNEQHGTWNNNIFTVSEENEKGHQIVFDETHFLFPLENKKINSGFGISPTRYHMGVDYEAKFGQIILASKSGEVVEIGYRENLGHYITILYPQYIKFTYAHLSKIYVKEGDYVEIGQMIGRVGISGKSTGPHLHLETTYQNIYINPDLFFK